MLMQGTGKLVLKDHFFLEAIKMASGRAEGVTACKGSKSETYKYKACTPAL